MSLKKYYPGIFAAIFNIIGWPVSAQVIPYAVPIHPWADSLGNHRAVVKVDKNADAVEVTIDWRRRDKDADKKAIIVTDESGRSVSNIYRIAINRERGDFVFQPNSGAGIYYIYYMPYKGKKNSGSWNGSYLRAEPSPRNEWLTANSLAAASSVPLKTTKAAVLRIESRTAFDSFYPMEVCATSAEVDVLNSQATENYLLFPEDRKYPIRMETDIPLRWVGNNLAKEFKGNAMRNEYYAFQVGVYAARKDLEDITVSYSRDNITCFNTGGTDFEGKIFTKTVNVSKGKVRALWFGVDIGKSQKPGIYSFTVTISPKNEKPQTIKVTLSIENKILEDRGDSEPWRHSRLRWLNSTLGINDNVVAPYTALQVKDKSIRSFMHEVKLDESGLPLLIDVNNKPVLQAPIRFLVETDKGVEIIKPLSFRYTKQNKGNVSWVAVAASDIISLTSNGEMEFDGTVDYTIKVTAKAGVQIKDIRLEIPVAKQTAQYFMGMGLPGSYCPPSYSWKWKGPQDSYWIGSVDAGLHCELRGASYSGPLLNLYHPAPPPSWYNTGKGGFTMQSSDKEVLTTTYSGSRSLNTGEALNFQFRLLITPVKKLNSADQFTTRYYHNGGGSPAPQPEDLKSGIKVINVHHANPINPYINYPFVAVDSMKQFVKTWHKKGLKVKIYYTIRELTNQVAEIWALRSLGNEILGGGSGGGYPWLREHYVENYGVQWFTTIAGYEACDAAVITSGQSRWNNYYIEGLRWLMKNIDIDGLYLDDVTFDRLMLKRMRKVMDEVKPGSLIDLHSNTGFSKGPANQYTEYFPYVNKLWFGESFMYNKMPPDNWMVEVSGIPFGLMGDMLHGGGNPWRGMVYGMTVRLPWNTEGVTCDPRDIWKIWDEFGIASANMIGYWEKGCPVSTNHPDINATIYQKKSRSLVSIASWSDQPVKFLFKFDWKALGIDSAKAIMVAPGIKNFQKYTVFNPTDSITIAPEKGWLLYIEEKK